MDYMKFKFYKPAGATHPDVFRAISIAGVCFRKFLKNFASKFKHLTLQAITLFQIIKHIIKL
jgi:hypothetical protein